MIVAQGRDAGVPHNSGNDREAVKVGETIVFDIFPQQQGGGYYFDFTRTICFGYAPKKYHEVYRLVKQAQDISFEQIRTGHLNIEIERSICKFFEKNGHPSPLSTPKTQSGYCHSLGHGLGLNIHESPGFGLFRTNKDRITAGHVFTVEPGLYYPEQDFGIRLEDVIYIDPKGKPVNITNHPRQLVVDM
jgi:Xaa-Pro aminopeptidase